MQTTEHSPPQQLIRDLTVDQLRTLIRLIVEEVLLEFFDDSNHRVTLNSEVKSKLLTQKHQPDQHERSNRQFGSAQGLLIVHDDFDESLFD
jgi:hypothetical protein